jgi:hypothetical protein
MGEVSLSRLSGFKARLRLYLGFKARLRLYAGAAQANGRGESIKALLRLR